MEEKRTVVEWREAERPRDRQKGCRRAAEGQTASYDLAHVTSFRLASECPAHCRGQIQLSGVVMGTPVDALVRLTWTSLSGRSIKNLSCSMKKANI